MPLLAAAQLESIREGRAETRTEDFWGWERLIFRGMTRTPLDAFTVAPWDGSSYTLRKVFSQRRCTS